MIQIEFSIIGFAYTFMINGPPVGSFHLHYYERKRNFIVDVGFNSVSGKDSRMKLAKIIIGTRIQISLNISASKSDNVPAKR